MHEFKDFTEEYGKEVHFINNRDEPFYRWYPFVEGFSGNIVKKIINELDYTPKLCLDPFSGSGTTPLACQEMGVKCVSFELNPFLYDVSRVKLYTGYVESHFEKLVKGIEKGLKTHCDVPDYPQIDTQTLFEKEGLKKWIFNKPVAWGILDILEELESISKESESCYKLLLKIALGAILVEVSNVFRNGKCLSYKKNLENNECSRQDVHGKFIGFCNTVILEDMREKSWNKIEAKNYELCVRGDAKKLLTDLEEDSIDLVITSPPYLNSRDYTDTYRLELWVLGYLKTYIEERELRRNAIRSHVQVVWPEVRTIEIPKLVEYLKEMEKHSDELWNKSIPNMIKGYFADMNDVLYTLYNKIKKNANVYIIVGNSSYHKRTIETDEVIADIAKLNGFHVEEIRVARYLKSSGQQNSKKIRESIIVMRKKDEEEVGDDLHS